MLPCAFGLTRWTTSLEPVQTLNDELLQPLMTAAEEAYQYNQAQVYDAYMSPTDHPHSKCAADIDLVTALCDAEASEEVAAGVGAAGKDGRGVDDDRARSTSDGNDSIAAAHTCDDSASDDGSFEFEMELGWGQVYDDD